MPTVTIRLDEETKQDLEILARGRNQSLSDLVRSALDDLLERDPKARVFDMTPTSLTVVDRQQLALLHRILAQLVEDDDDEDGDREYQRQRATVLEEGYVAEYSREFSGISPELSHRDSKFVLDVLDLFQAVTLSLGRLHDTGMELDEKALRMLRFDGFDLQDNRETRLLSYARFLVDEDHWSELQETFSDANDRGNSHRTTADGYQRMLDGYDHLKADKENRAGKTRSPFDPDSYLLTAEELRRLALSRVHPSHEARQDWDL